MANPRQRRKARSSSHKPVSHSNRAKKMLKKTPPIRGPKVLQEAWDNRKTVRQNYAALGLIHSLNPSASGGAEQPLVPRRSPEPAGEHAQIQISADDDSEHGRAAAAAAAAGVAQAPQEAQRIPRGHGRIVRDEAGNVLRVELAEEDEAEDNVGGAEVDMDALEPQLDEKASRAWVGGLGASTSSQANADSGSGSKGVVEELERICARTKEGTTISAPLSMAGPRHASEGERVYLDRLIAKYGEDVEGMARDRRLNPEQRTAGQLRRSLKRRSSGR